MLIYVVSLFFQALLHYTFGGFCCFVLEFLLIQMYTFGVVYIPNLTSKNEYEVYSCSPSFCLEHCFFFLLWECNISIKTRRQCMRMNKESL